MSSINFDLTSPEGMNGAIEAFDKYGWALPGMLPVWAVRKTYKAMTSNAVATTKSQKQAAIEIIRAGQKNGVDSMTIKMDRTAGIDLGANVDGIPIKFKVGDAGTIEISVKYKGRNMTKKRLKEKA